MQESMNNNTYSKRTDRQKKKQKQNKSLCFEPTKVSLLLSSVQRLHFLNFIKNNEKNKKLIKDKKKNVITKVKIPFKKTVSRS